MNIFPSPPLLVTARGLPPSLPPGPALQLSPLLCPDLGPASCPCLAALLPHLSWPGEERQGAQAWGQAAPGAVAEPGGWSSSPAPPMTCGAAFVPPGDSLSQRLTWQNRASGLGTAETLSLGGSSLGRLGRGGSVAPLSSTCWTTGPTGTPRCPAQCPPHSRSSINGRA